MGKGGSKWKNFSLLQNAISFFDVENSSSNGFVMFVCLSYGVASLALVLLNYSLFTSWFKYPIFVTWTQQMLGSIAYWTSYSIGKRFMVKHLKVQDIYLNSINIKFFAPLVLSFVGMVAFANLCLKFALVSTYQTARCLTIFWTLLFSTLLLKQHFKVSVLLACSIQAIGFLIGSLDVSTLTRAGSIFGCLSSLCQGVYNVSVKKCLPFVRDSTLSLLAVNLSLSSFLFFPLIFVFGEADVFGKLPYNIFTEEFWSIWTPILLSGVLASVLNLVSYAVIQVTSPVTYNIVGVLKSCIQTSLGLFFMGDPVTFKSLSGIMLTITGSALYGYLRLSERAEKPATSGYIQTQAMSDDSDEEQEATNVIEIK